MFRQYLQKIDEKEVIKNINFEIDEGEFEVLICPSGCGKTTLLKMINRLILPTKGKILINNMDIKETNVIKIRRKIGYVLPISFAYIIGGIKTALVVAIGLTTLGAFIGGAGLESIIIRGTNVTDGTAIILAGALAPF
ncbi:ATP-binding cassette domain-containing protein [Lysinibacillus sp. JNUCC 51]|uniref:ATP-binding cassette domain-containing protein n=1 Tax=Lysinibacillus sp. JNUCC-51 TaxID=2792479 RepID=UPI001935FBEE|nr:ATP-binding cassette domain-containing protein [Lysinibacillus sp. JNUCC-51]